ncbi:MAG TPA: methyltransferase domain-containing protein [Longimicrobium sp.]|jgi:SAM-dependent methyltransferase|uniref:class I SAM-dependent methyltransferase n=1 Tax=Longimicrobium sp. TaxID=2029185 RepID=UPI002EDA8759
MIGPLRNIARRTPLWSSLRESSRVRSALGFEPTIWTRKAADEAVRALLRPYDPPTLDALEISGNVWRADPFRSHRSTSYPEFDICADVLPETFDVVIMEHILEHLREPGRAVRNARAMLRPGGLLLVVTPFLYKVHPDPIDTGRWTEQGMRFFLEDHGFPADTTVTGSWGNRQCLLATLKREFILFNRHLHPMHNEPEYPIVVWALARNPGA